MAPPVGEEEEKKHFLRILQAFRNYNRDAKDRLHGSMDYFKRIPAKHKSLLKDSGFEDNLKNVENCIDVNSGVIKEIIGMYCQSMNFYRWKNPGSSLYLLFYNVVFSM